MGATIQQPVTTTFQKKERKASLWKRFIQWADGQDENRFTWVAISLAGHGCVFTVITILVVMLTGNNFIFWPFAIAAMGTCLIVNLAALPTKITIPVLFASLLIDLLIIALAISSRAGFAA